MALLYSRSKCSIFKQVFCNCTFYKDKLFILEWIEDSFECNVLVCF